MSEIETLEERTFEVVFRTDYWHDRQVFHIRDEGMAIFRTERRMSSASGISFVRTTVEYGGNEYVLEDIRSGLDTTVVVLCCSRLKNIEQDFRSPLRTLISRHFYTTTPHDTQSVGRVIEQIERYRKEGSVCYMV